MSRTWVTAPHTVLNRRAKALFHNISKRQKLLLRPFFQKPIRNIYSHVMELWTFSQFLR